MHMPLKGSLGCNAWKAMLNTEKSTMQSLIYFGNHWKEFY